MICFRSFRFSRYKTALEWAVWRGETSRVEALLPELLALKLRLRRLAQRVPHLWDVWNLENASDGLEAKEAKAQKNKIKKSQGKTRPA